VHVANNLPITIVQDVVVPAREIKHAIVYVISRLDFSNLIQNAESRLSATRLESRTFIQLLGIR
jgi:hypothetical protein